MLVRHIGIFKIVSILSFISASAYSQMTIADKCSTTNNVQL